MTDKDKDMMDMIKSSKAYEMDVFTRMKDAFGEGVAESALTLLHTNLAVDSMMAKIESSRPEVSQEGVAQVMDGLLTILFDQATQSIWEGFQEINLRFMRQLLDDEGVSNDMRKKSRMVLTEVIMASPEFLEKQKSEAWNQDKWEIDWSVELGGALSFMYAGVTMKAMMERAPQKKAALDALDAKRQPAATGTH